MNETIRTFGYPETVVREYERWIVLLRPEQVTIGTLVLAAKSEARHLGELDNATWTEFYKVCRDVEDLLRKSFGAEKFNYLALMMKDPNVHFHFVPRYSKPIIIDNLEYRDPDWPFKTKLKATELSKEAFEQIKSRLKSA